MMNKQIRRMIDEIFADMKMTADNLALRDEMMANAQARFEDSVRAGTTEEEAFAEVAASLGDVQSLLHAMKKIKKKRPRKRPRRPKRTKRRISRSEPKKRRISATCWARPSARWATWASRLCRRHRSWFGRWTT